MKKKTVILACGRIYQWEQKTKVVIIGIFLLFVIFLASRCGGDTGEDKTGEVYQADTVLTDKGPEVYILPPQCVSDSNCDDKIGCSVDKCIQGNCIYTPDNNKCGSEEVCDVFKGGCLKAKSCFKDEDCEDIFKCTVEGCDQKTNLCKKILDDSRCPKDYICFVPTKFYKNMSDEPDPYNPNKEEISGCLPTKRCQNDVDCIPPNSSSCAVGKCVINICIYSANSAACDDGDVCNGKESCHVLGDPEEYGGDLGPCSFDGQYNSYGYYFPDYCYNYNCKSGKDLSCDDGNPCTDDSCDPKKGCVYTPNSSPCNDNNDCTINDYCQNEKCFSGSLDPCDDGDPCAMDSCKSEAICTFSSEEDTKTCGDWSGAGKETPGCHHDPIPEMTDQSCDTPCMKDGICSGGQCSGGEPIVCNDNNFCTEDSCNPLKGCINKLIIECGPDGQGKTCGECTEGKTCINKKCYKEGSIADNGDGTVIDLKTKLMWQKKYGFQNGCTWYEASSYCNDLELANYSDWRLPTIDELRTLIIGCPDTMTGGKCQAGETCDYDCWLIGCTGCKKGKGPGPYGCYYDNIFEMYCSSYWSSTPELYMGDDWAWVIEFIKAEVNSGPKYESWYGSLNVRCVR